MSEQRPKLPLPVTILLWLFIGSITFSATSALALVAGTLAYNLVGAPGQ
jgi:hypothetical protein